MANVSVANSTLTKPLANSISTICECKISTISDDIVRVLASIINAVKEQGPDLFDYWE